MHPAIYDWCWTVGLNERLLCLHYQIYEAIYRPACQVNVSHSSTKVYAYLPMAQGNIASTAVKNRCSLFE
jgi:hypothetical protein